ncbi:hypothetical protein C8R42DRAFT_637328 [Lentinula raphanica]|nr:hypothetical protein C8R42DRAFT_637328 [Lentinula raphanica]
MQACEMIMVMPKGSASGLTSRFPRYRLYAHCTRDLRLSGVHSPTNCPYDLPMVLAEKGLEEEEVLVVTDPWAIRSRKLMQNHLVYGRVFTDELDGLQAGNERQSLFALGIFTLIMLFNLAFPDTVEPNTTALEPRLHPSTRFLVEMEFQALITPQEHALKMSVETVLERLRFWLVFMVESVCSILVWPMTWGGSPP